MTQRTEKQEEPEEPKLRRTIVSQGTLVPLSLVAVLGIGVWRYSEAMNDINLHLTRIDLLMTGNVSEKDMKILLLTIQRDNPTMKLPDILPWEKRDR